MLQTRLVQVTDSCKMSTQQNFYQYLLGNMVRYLPIASARQKVTQYCVQYQNLHLHSNEEQVYVKKRILLDVSVIVQHDAGTGIQRVVRSVWKELTLLSKIDKTFVVVPISATINRDFHYISADGKKIGAEVEVTSTDIFLGLDLSSRILSKRQNTLLRWKRLGVKLNFILYDLLPLQHSDWFTQKNVKNFERWFRVVVIYADRILCISNDVKNNMRKALDRLSIRGEKQPILAVFPLGANIVTNDVGNIEATPLPKSLSQLCAQPYFLMVGTIEARKGHDVVLDAMTKLWSQQFKYNLVLVGRKGWGTKRLQIQITNHPLYTKKLHWFKDISDVHLDRLYQCANGVIVASKGEGYGLPLREALYYDKEVLVRNLPIFYEVGMGNQKITYFDDSVSLDLIIREWETRLLNTSPTPPLEKSIFRSWAECSEEWKKLLLDKV